MGYNYFNMFKNIFIFLLFFLGSTSTSYAYLDPGSVNIILQFFALILTGIVTSWLFLKNTIKNFLNKLFFKKKEEKSTKEE